MSKRCFYSSNVFQQQLKNNIYFDHFLVSFFHVDQIRLARIPPPLPLFFFASAAATAARHKKDQAFFELGGDALASTAPSSSMTSNLIGLLEGSLGLGVWADPVASQLARPLNAILAYLSPEGARVRRLAFASVQTNDARTRSCLPIAILI